MDEIMNLFGNYVFPVGMCIYLVYINEKQDSRHREETKELSEVINNNTTAIERILEHIRSK